MKRVVYIHGNGTTHWSQSWARWLEAEVRKAGYKTFFETMPDSILARAEYWLPFLEKHVRVGRDDIVVGWSSGAVAAMRYAEKLHVGPMILVSPCVSDLGDEMERQSGYFNDPWLWSEIRRNSGPITLITGDDDPFIPQSEFDEAAVGLAAQRVQIEGGGHFMDRVEFPEVLDAIRRCEE
jgi:uncharacterized protein